MPDELDKILDMYDRRGIIGVPPTKLDRPEAKARLNALFLSQALDLIGADYPISPGMTSEFLIGERKAHNRFKAELRAAAQAKYGGSE